MLSRWHAVFALLIMNRLSPRSLFLVAVVVAVLLALLHQASEPAVRPVAAPPAGKFRAPPPPKEGPRINREIRGVPQVQLIDEEGNNVGVVPFFDALDRAEDAGMDLVEIAPQAIPPVCKLLDYGRFKYQAQKKASETRKNQKIVEIKEIKVRPNIDDHDYDVKMKQSRRFFEEGDKVKITLRFRGREMAHQGLGVQLLERVRAEVADVAKVESEPRLEGKQMIMILAPR